jgi:hypothetical protein
MARLSRMPPSCRLYLTKGGLTPIHAEPGQLSFAAFGPSFHAFGMQSIARGAAPSCHSDTLPSAISAVLKEQFRGWKVQDPQLSAQARGADGNTKTLGLWTVPGITIGRFENTNLSYALLLVPEARPDARLQIRGVYTFQCHDRTII